MSWSSRRLRGSQRGELGCQRIVRKLELIIGTLIFATSGQLPLYGGHAVSIPPVAQQHVELVDVIVGSTGLAFLS